jgi:riboflavin transporter FmnP
LNTKKLALTIVFAALAIVLNPAFTQIQLYFPLAQGLIYQIWEIPIIIALLIISPIAAIAISGLNTLVLFAVFQGVLPTGPLYNLAATLSMQLGIVIALIIGRKFYCAKGPEKSILSSFKWGLVATGFGMFTRTALMSVLLYFALPQTPPIGFSFPLEATIAYLPFAAIFNASLAAYTILIAYFIAGRVRKVLHLTMPGEAKNGIAVK